MGKLQGSSTGTESPAGKTGGGSTTFVQADSTCFRELVQRLTGPPAAEMAVKKPTTGLHERRKLYARPKVEVDKVYGVQAAAYSHPCGSNKRVSLEESGALKEKRSYLHPSPRSRPRLDLEDNGAAPQPKLLTLFPLTSPTAADNAKFP
ncbi:VQ motif-containing protein [Dorcoceras hygrometricum]|uniref:VQ motif-containing protein n=1 Tax=Dorcoceras hygrometricum TaxID=472368 RepID=A0A2Z7AEM4_9LAMI|nr:VQ motif-containing protein [Dorcoceras hygrometricum]